MHERARANWNHLGLPSAPTSATGLTCKRNCPSSPRYIRTSWDPREPGCFPNHKTSRQIGWVRSTTWAATKLHSIQEKPASFSLPSKSCTCLFCAKQPRDIQERNSGKRSSGLAKLTQCKAQEDTHRLRVSWANQMCGHPPDTAQPLVPFSSQLRTPV